MDGSPQRCAIWLFSRRYELMRRETWPCHGSKGEERWQRGHVVRDPVPLMGFRESEPRWEQSGCCWEDCGCCGLRWEQSSSQLPGLVGEAGSNSVFASSASFISGTNISNRSGEGSANLTLLPEVSPKVFPQDVSSDTRSHGTDCPSKQQPGSGFHLGIKTPNLCQCR